MVGRLAERARAWLPRLALWLLPASLILPSLGAPGCASGREAREEEDPVAHLAGELGVEIAVGPDHRRRYDRPGHTPFASARPSREELEAALPLLREELGKIGPVLIACAELDRIALVRSLRIGPHHRSAAVDFEADTVVFDVVALASSPAFGREVVHHEFFHMLDHAHDELIRHDRAWAQLNAPGFDYGAGGDRYWHDRETAYDFYRPPPEFVTRYATLGAEEDKAETFAFLMTSDDCAPREDADVGPKVRFLSARVLARCPGSALPSPCG